MMDRILMTSRSTLMLSRMAKGPDFVAMWFGPLDKMMDISTDAALTGLASPWLAQTSISSNKPLNGRAHILDAGSEMFRGDNRPTSWHIDVDRLPHFGWDSRLPALTGAMSVDLILQP